ncbi:bacteriorhodopsin [Halohasta salina]|uniref:bacteriorhodopsin n=1 Tax=Halohasta salina TaxID=2961621 RepID=UPI0020A34ABF|nr:bacteriorhodopsin [Halohasta salina]
MGALLAAVGATLGGRPAAGWLVGGAVVFGLASLLVAARAAGSEDRRTRRSHALVAVVSATSVGAYALLLSGVGTVDVAVPDGEAVTLYWARYVDWLVTMPLLVAALGSVAGVDRETLASAVATTVFVVVTGIVSTGPVLGGYRYVWVGIATLAVGGVGYFLGVGLRADTRGLATETTATVDRLATLLGVCWVGYPLWWIAGPGGAGVVSPTAATAGFVALDLLATIGFALVLLRSPAVSDRGAAPAPGAGDQASRLT